MGGPEGTIALSLTLFENRRDKSMRSLFERALENTEDRNHMSQGTISTVTSLPPTSRSSLENGLTEPASTLTGAEHSSRILRPRFTARLVNTLAQAARTNEGERAMPALAEPMITALWKRFPTPTAFVELDTFATSHWYLESARCVKREHLVPGPAHQDVRPRVLLGGLPLLQGQERLAVQLDRLVA